MFLYRRPLRKEMDVFDVHEDTDLRAYNLLMAAEGIDVRIVSQKEFSVKGGPGFEDSPGTPNSLYVLVTYQLLTDRYERSLGRSARPFELRKTKEKPDAGKKRPKIVPQSDMTPEEIEIASRIIQTSDGPVIDVEGHEVKEQAPEAPPKVVALDLFRGGQKTQQKGPDDIVGAATDAINKGMAAAEEALAKAGLKTSAKKRYSRAEVAEGLVDSIYKGKGSRPSGDKPRGPRKPRRPKE